jgi:hypothetical protein
MTLTALTTSAIVIPVAAVAVVLLLTGLADATRVSNRARQAMASAGLLIYVLSAALRAHSFPHFLALLVAIVPALLLAFFVRGCLQDSSIGDCASR